MGWRFTAIPSFGQGEFELTDAYNRGLTVRLDQFSEGTFTIDGRSPQAALLTEYQTDILAYRDGQLHARGRMVGGQAPETLTADGQHLRTVTFRDYRARYDRVLLFPTDKKSWTGDTGDIPRQLLAQANSHTGMSAAHTWVATAAQNPGPTVGNVQQQDFSAMQSFTACVDQLAQQDPGGFEWTIDEHLQLRIYPGGMGSVKASPYEWPGGKIASITKQVDDTSYGNAVFATGGANALGTALPTQIVSPPDENTRPEGRWDLTVANNDIVHTATLLAYANWKLGVATSQPVSYQAVLTPGAWQGRSDLWVGDTVPLIVRSGVLDVHTGIRCTELDITCGEDGDGSESVTAVFGRPRTTIRDRLRTTRMRLDAVERTT